MPERMARRRDPERPEPAKRAAPPDPVLALQRSLGNAAVGKLLRARKYIRAVSDLPSAQKDIDTLNAAPNLPRGELPPDLSWWLEGMGAMSTTRYNEGQKHYLYPVGFVIELDRDEQVHGNYSGDGNTGSPMPGMTNPDNYWQAFEAIRVALAADSIVGEPWRAHAGDVADAAITGEGTIDPLKTKLKSFLTSTPVKAVKDQTVKLMETAVSAALRAHYSNPKRVSATDITPRGEDKVFKMILGAGLNPAGLDEMEQALREAKDQRVEHGASSETKYTESKTHVRKPDVKGTFYNSARGAYSVGSADWTGDQWLERRWQDADTLRTRLGSGELEKLEEGVLKASGPPAPVQDLGPQLPADVRDLMAVLGCDAETAERLLAANDRNPQRAVNAFFG